MSELRLLFEDLGFRDVRTLLNSGNVVFSVPDNRRGTMLRRIQKGLAGKLGFTSLAIVLSGDEVVEIVNDNPLVAVARDPSRLLVVVPKEASDLNRLRPLLNQQWKPEVLAVGRRVAYLWCANGVGQSSLWPTVDRALDRSNTARNIATMTKLMAVVKGPSS